MKKIILSVLIALCAGFIIGSAADIDLKGIEYFLSDDVSGSNLELIEFDDELEIIDNLLWSDLVKRNANKFEGAFTYWIPEEGDVQFTAEDVIFYGKTTFDEGSKVEFRVENFSITDSNMDEYGLTEAFGEAIFVYEQEVVIKKSMPVDVTFYFYEDEEDSDYDEQEIIINSLNDERLYVTFQNKEGRGRYFRHDRDCEGDCFEEYEGGHEWVSYEPIEEGSKKWVPLHSRVEKNK